MDIVSDTDEQRNRLESAITTYTRRGWRVLLVEPGGKKPAPGWSVKTATTHSESLFDSLDDLTLDELGNPTGDLPNIGIEAGAGLVIVDFDTEKERDAFARALGVETITPTVHTPGMKDENGEWAHSGGGHLYYTVPAGDAELSSAIALLGATHKWRGVAEVKLHDSYVVAPPSVRAEGAYTLSTSDALSRLKPVPAPLREVLVRAAQRKRERAEKKRKTTSAVPSAAAASEQEWEQSTPWSELLLDSGLWSPEPEPASCGCDLWRYSRASNDRSAIAHEPGCADGHKPVLHLFSETAKADYDAEQLFKLAFYAHHHTGGNLPAARKQLGLPEWRVAREVWSFAGSEPGATAPASVAAAPATAPAPVPVPVPTPVAAAPAPVPTPLAPVPAPAPAELPSLGDLWVGELEQQLGRLLTDEQKKRAIRLGGSKELRGIAPDKFRSGLYPAGLTADPELVKKVMGYNDFTRACFWAAEDTPAPASPLAVLAHQLLRVARRVHPRASLSPGLHTTASFYCAVVGRSGTGKTRAGAVQLPVRVTAGDPTSDIPATVDDAIDPASPQALGAAVLSLDEDGRPAAWQVQHVMVDELTRLLTTTGGTGAGGGMLPALTAAWAGENFLPSSRANGGARLQPRSFTVTLIGGLQGALASTLLGETDLGFTQRFLFVDAAYPLKGLLDERDIPRVGAGYYLPHPPLGADEKLRWDSSVAVAVAEAGLAGYAPAVDERLEKESQLLTLRTKLTALIALADERKSASLADWTWAGDVLELHHRAVAAATVAAEQAAAKKAAETGHLKGLEQAAALAGRAGELGSWDERVLEKLHELGGGGAVKRSDLTARFGRNKHSFAQVGTALERLEQRGEIFATKDGRATLYTPAG